MKWNVGTKIGVGFGLTLVIFLVVKIVNKLRKTDPSRKDCPYCLTSIPIIATRCSACCAELKAA